MIDTKFYTQGQGVPRSEEKAIHWLRALGRQVFQPALDVLDENGISCHE